MHGVTENLMPIRTGKQNQYLYTLVVNSNFRALLLRVYYDELMKTGLIY
jgi:hypothetical protein